MAHKSPTARDRVAIAPYNFVSLPDNIALPPEKLGEYDQDIYKGHSGYIDLTFEVLSPLYIRGMMNPQDYLKYGKKKVADFPTPEKKEEFLDKISPFFVYNNQKYIPGSSLRGMFRTLVEVVSFSNLYEVTNKRMMYRSLDDTNHGVSYRRRFYSELRVPSENSIKLTPKFKAGYLYEHRNKWYIQPAQELGSSGKISFAKVPHAIMKQEGFRLNSINDPKALRHTVYFQPASVEFHQIAGKEDPKILVNSMWVNKITSNKDDSLVKGWLVVSGPMETKHSEMIIFPEDRDKVPLDVPPELIKLYKEDGVPMFRNTPLFPEGKTGVLLDKDRRTPVFYLVENGEVVTFAHCAQARIPYLNDPSDLIPDELKTTKNDMAELMFGYVRKEGNKTEARAGRVFFEDALLQEGSDKIPGLIPKILSSPKPTTFQHYLEQDEPDNKDALNDYDAEGAKIRGHKFYWSKGKNPDFISKEIERDGKIINTVPEKLRTKMKPVAPDAHFTTRIRFENLTSEELGCLVKVIKLGADDKLCLRLGMGKPYGLGAIRIKSKEIYLINRAARYANKQSSTLDRIELAPQLALLATEEMNKHLDSFSDWLRKQINDESSISRRNQELEVLLRWNPGASKKHEYMHLSHFSDRRVLPNPGDVDTLTPDISLIEPKPKKRYPKTPPKKGIAKPEVVFTTVRQPKSPKGTGASMLDEKPQALHKKGDILTVEIVDMATQTDILCKWHGSVAAGNNTYIIRRKHTSGKKIKEDESWRCSVREVEQDADGFYYYLLPDKKM